MINQIDHILWFKVNALYRYLLAHTVSKILPLYIINEYPKSGGAWVGEMLGDMLDLPFPRNRLPVFKASILHGHMMHSWNMRKPLIVWRDGRDILISQYYHSLFENDRGNSRLVRECRADLCFPNYDDIRTNLPEFMEYVYVTKRHPKISWLDFGNCWAGRKDCIHVKYEALRLQPEQELHRVIAELTGKEMAADHVAEVVDRHSFQRISGRKPGEESVTSFLRKGVVGDWKNHFSDEARKQFDAYAGDLLIKLGYEVNHEWSH